MILKGIYPGNGPQPFGGNGFGDFRHIHSNVGDSQGLLRRFYLGLVHNRAIFVFNINYHCGCAVFRRGVQKCLHLFPVAQYRMGQIDRPDQALFPLLLLRLGGRQRHRGLGGALLRLGALPLGRLFSPAGDILHHRLIDGDPHHHQRCHQNRPHQHQEKGYHRPAALP